MAPSAHDALVASLLTYYDSQVRKFNPTPFQFRHFTPGENITRGMLWKKLVEIAEWCAPRKIPPLNFVRAQFEMWRTPSNPKAKGIGYPTPRFLGLTQANLDRYEQWIGKQRSLMSATVVSASSQVDETVATFLRNRPDLLSEEDVFRDPLLVLTMSPEAVRTHPTFVHVVESGAFPEGSFARKLLQEYIPSADTHVPAHA